VINWAHLCPEGSLKREYGDLKDGYLASNRDRMKVVSHEIEKLIKICFDDLDDGLKRPVGSQFDAVESAFAQDVARDEVGHVFELK
jgi:hypothetical protein